MLENFESHWNYTDAGKRYATYTNLKPGEYIFKVRGTNSDGVWSEHVASLKVTVTPPFWDTWWFRLVIAVIVLLSIFLVHRIWLQLKLENLLTMERMKTQEAENIRKRVAMDFHDEMGNQLASMTALINLINLRRSKNDSNFDDLLLKLDQNAQNLFYGTRDFIWSINPKSDKAEEVLLNIKDFAEDLFFGSGITFHFDNYLRECGVVFPPGSSRHITLICKEIFTNCMKHACCSNVRLSCRYENNIFSLTIKDDGKGFLPEELKRDGNGLQNIKSRARKTGASVEVVSALRAGTTITVELPVPKKGE
jgi:signal transduction histidine kinase